jgi:hypothetical protein
LSRPIASHHDFSGLLATASASNLLLELEPIRMPHDPVLTYAALFLEALKEYRHQMPFMPRFL